MLDFRTNWHWHLDLNTHSIVGIIVGKILEKFVSPFDVMKNVSKLLKFNFSDNKASDFYCLPKKLNLLSK